MKPLYEHDMYRNTHIDYLFNQPIIEYDISDAGLNISYYYHLLPEEKLDKIKAMPKSKHAKELGLIQRANPEYKEALSKAFIDIRKLFFEANDLDDTDILTIKKDAIFTTRPLQATIFDNVEFKEKNRYTSYIYNGLELYYSEKNGIDVKGISDVKLRDHKEYILSFFQRFFHMMETTSRVDVLRYLCSFYTHYKWRDLDIGYYREFNQRSEYRIDINQKTDYEIEGNIDFYTSAEAIGINRLDISHNAKLIKDVVILVSKILL